MTLLPSARSACLVLCFAASPLVGCGKEAAFATEQTDAKDSKSQEANNKQDSGADDSFSNDAPKFDADGLDLTGSELCPPTQARCSDFGMERPDRLSEHTAVYDNERMQMLIFGGTPNIPTNCQPDGVSRFSAELWVYDDPCNRWVQLADAGFARGRHSAAIGDDAMWIFGGRYRDGSGGDYTLYNDLKRFDLETQQWSDVSVSGDAPSKRLTAAMSYDSSRNQLWVFGGNSAASGLVYEPLDDLWSYDIKSHTWTQVETGTRPPARLFQSMLYDAERDQLVIFGGANETAFDNFPEYFGDVWAFDIGASEWTQLATENAGPNGRFWSSLVHDTQRDSYVIFGGHDPGTLITGDSTLGNLNDAWSFDPDERQWTQLFQGDTFNTGARGTCDFPPDFANIDAALPERRSAHSLVWSTGCQHALLFGGKTDCGSTDDVWRFSQELWVERAEAREGEVCYRWRDDIQTCSDICF